MVTLERKTSITRFCIEALSGSKPVIIKEAQNLFKRETGEDALFYYFTFRNDDYGLYRISLFCMNYTPKSIFIAAEENHIEAAVKYIIETNSHVKLLLSSSGYNADDFAMARITTELIVKPCKAQ